MKRLSLLAMIVVMLVVLFGVDMVSASQDSFQGEEWCSPIFHKDSGFVFTSSNATACNNLYDMAVMGGFHVVQLLREFDMGVYYEHGEIIGKDLRSNTYVFTGSKVYYEISGVTNSGVVIDKEIIDTLNNHLKNIGRNDLMFRLPTGHSK